MKDYYDILDIPLNASIEQIKSRYKQLVRIYHPDRFSNALDKVYAEHKLKEVNEAYSYLTSDIDGLTLFNTLAVLPEPTVEPAYLDFGVLNPGEQQVLRFEVSNMGGPASGVSFVCSEENGWFRISNGKRVEQTKTLPMIFEVVADIRPAFPPRHYGGWIEISMDGVKTRVELQVEVQALPVKPRFQLPTFQLRNRLLVLVGLFCLLAVLLNTGISQSVAELFNSFRLSQSAILVSASSEPESVTELVTLADPSLTPTPLPSPLATLPVITRVIAPAVVTAPEEPPATPVPAQRFVSPAQERAALAPLTDAESATGEAIALAVLQSLDALVASTVPSTTVALSAILPVATATSVLPAPTATPLLPTATPLLPTATAPATATPPPTATSLPTGTPVPLPTSTALPPTATAAPSATALPASGLYEILMADGSPRLAITLAVPADFTVNVRYAWDIRSPAIAVLYGGTRIPAIGRSSDNAWVQVVLPDGQLGWIFTDVISPDYNQIIQLPLELAPQWP